MATTSGLGFKRNLTKLYLLIGHTKTFPNYKPAVQEHNIADMEAFAANVVTTGGQYNDKEGDYKKGVGARQAVFDKLDSFCTRLNRSFKLQVKDLHARDQMDHWLKKVRGVRIGDEPAPKELGAEEKDNSRSVSQQGFDDQVDHFGKMVELCVKHPEFAPNEPDLKLAALQAKHAAMEASNIAASTVETQFNDIQRKRRAIHYANEGSIFAIGNGVKNYVISAYGFDSPEAKIVRKIPFTRPKGDY
jgi:hypothetical protein